MIRKPRFRSHLQVRIVPPDLVVFADETGQSGLKGVLFPLLAPLIDGTRTVEDIVDALPEQHILDLHYALTLLEQEGHIIEADDPRNPYQQGFGDALGLDPRLQHERLERIRIQIAACGPVATGPLEDLLDRNGVRRGEGGDLLVVVTDDYLRDDLGAISRHALETGRPWMPVKPVGSVVWIGPVFVPERTACWSCLAERLRQNRPLEAFAALHGAEDPVRPDFRNPSLASTAETAFGIAATEIFKWVAGEGNASLADTLLTFDLCGTSMKKHRVVRLPHCVECGSPELVAGCNPPALESTARLPVLDGGYRSVHPGRTLDRLAHHVSPLTGIVDEIRPLQDDGLVQVYRAGYAFTPGLRDRGFFDQGLRNQSTGKGLSREQAKASALCEALERYSGVHTGRESRRRATYADLGADAIHPGEHMLFSVEQYEQRLRLNETRTNWIPEPFDEKREVDWSPLWSLSNKKVRFLPTACCFYGHPRSPGHDFGRADSNGCAAGNTVAEAVLQGFLEVVERDAVALWWYNRARRPAVNLARFDHPYLSSLARHYREVRRRFWVLDITADFPIPVVAALSLPEGDVDAGGLIMGFGAHLDPVIAILRAVTEMNQLLPAAVRGTGRSVCDTPLEDTHFLHPDPDSPGRLPHSTAPGPGADIGVPVSICLGLAAERGMDVLVLDQTRPEIGLPVVKVFIPGMRPFWPRFAPGRLYTVPVALGWREAPTREKGLNRSHLTI